MQKIKNKKKGFCIMAVNHKGKIDATHGYAVITYLFKYGGESSHVIVFKNDRIRESFDFDRWFTDRITHECGMFPVNGSERISIDTIARINCEVFDGEDY